MDNTTFSDLDITGAYNLYTLDVGDTQFTETCTYDNDPTITHNVESRIVAGLSVSGIGIPSGATIASITDTTHFELSTATTGGGVAAGTLTFNGKVIGVASTTGIKAGMLVKDHEHELGEETTTRITADTTVVSLVTNDTVTLSAPAAGNMAVGERLLLSSDWDYELVSGTASINGASSIVTATGVIKIKKYGMTAPDGNIVLQPNFITVNAD